MFQFLKLFPSQMEIVGAVVIPGLVFAIIFLMPFNAKTTRGHYFNICFFIGLLGVMATLTWFALATDSKNMDYQVAVKMAQLEARRVTQLTHSPLGVPTSGAITLLRNDPLTQGPKLFAKNCASCHRFNGHDGAGHVLNEPQRASDLAGFGSRGWLVGLLDPARVASSNYFGATKFKDGKMPKFVMKDVAHYSPEQKDQLAKVIAAVSAEANLKSQADLDRNDAAIIAQGRALLRDSMKCADCHQFRVADPDATAPDLTGWGSREWLVKFISNPAHADFYGDHNDHMPAFGEKQILSQQSIGLIADWLRGDWYAEADPQIPSLLKRK